MFRGTVMTRGAYLFDRLLFLYHDWLRGEVLPLVSRVSRPHPGGEGSMGLRPVRPAHGPEARAHRNRALRH